MTPATQTKKGATKRFTGVSKTYVTNCKALLAKTLLKVRQRGSTWRKLTSLSRVLRLVIRAFISSIRNSSSIVLVVMVVVLVVVVLQHKLKKRFECVQYMYTWRIKYTWD